MPSYYRRERCRLCEAPTLENVLSLRPTPPANELLGSAAETARQEEFPLDLHLCAGCGHLGLVDVVDPARLFSNYVYVSGTSPVFVRHFEDYAACVRERFGLGPGDFAVDIGSNDGVLLRALQREGLRVLGIDPASDIAARASAEGIPTWTAFFDQEIAERVVDEWGQPRLVTANNVFAHADDLPGIAAGVRDLLAPDGVFVFEVSYLLDVYEKNLFDTIYHEHLAYHTLRPLLPFFESVGLEVFDAERVGSHGGSLRVFVQLGKGSNARTERVDALIGTEERAGLFDVTTYGAWSDRIAALGDELSECLGGFRAKGMRIGGFGAPAKATTLLHQFGIGRELIEFIIDDSPWKQGLYLPGLGIPIVGPNDPMAEGADALLVLAWNFADPIIERHAAFLAQGGTFVVPLPELRIEGGGAR